MLQRRTGPLVRTLSGVLLTALAAAGAAGCSAPSGGTDRGTNGGSAAVSSGGSTPGPEGSSPGSPAAVTASAPGPAASGAAASVDLPADEGADPTVQRDTGAVAGCASRSLPSGWLAAENARPGSPVVPDAGGGPVLGYLAATSAVCGERLAVHLSGPRQTVRLVAYRLGDYRGVGTRFVWQSGDIAVVPQPVPAATPEGLVEPAWPPTSAIAVTADYPPGMYDIVPIAADGRGAVGPPIPLVVRDDAGREPLLVMASTLTWNAYSDWGGRSLYFGPGATRAAQLAARARVVAVHRPLTGSGFHQWTAMDVPLVHWVETLGVDVAYTTDVALAARPSTALQHSALVAGGHSEYWTRRLYDTVQGALGHGVSVAMLGANNAWWQVRLEASGTHEVVYRDLSQDPVAADDPTASTVLWERAPLNRPWAAVSGQSHAGVAVRGGLQLVDPPGWLVAGTTLHSGSVLPGVVGNEADGFHPAAQRPAALQVVAAGVITGTHGPATVSVNYVTTDSGAALFTAGTTMWACELDPSCHGASASAATRAQVRALTRNVLQAFAEPGAGRRNPAEPIVVGPAALLATSLPAQAVGSYGGAAE